MKAGTDENGVAEACPLPRRDGMMPVASRDGSRWHPTGAVTAWDYGANGLLSSLRHTFLNPVGGPAIAPFVFDQFSYDQQGNLAGFNTSRWAPQLDQQTSFDYNAMGWLYHDATERGGGYEGYHSYDLAGNLLAFRSPTPPPTAPGSTVNDNDQLLFGRDQSGQLGQILWRADGTPSIYKSTDPAHAPTTQFDPQQHLLSGIGTAEHGYRGDGLRAWREVEGQRTWYVYDGLTPIAELDAEGSLVTSRTYGLTGPVARGEVYYLFDLLGDVAVRLWTGRLSTLGSHTDGVQCGFWGC